MPDTDGSYFSSPRYDSVLPAAAFQRRHKQHLEGWGDDMSRRAGLGILDSTLAGFNSVLFDRGLNLKFPSQEFRKFLGCCRCPSVLCPTVSRHTM